MTGRLELAPELNSRDGASAEAPVRIVLADDHAIVRRSVRLLLDGERDIEVVAEPLDLGAVTRDVESHRPQVLVLDIRIQNGSSIEAIRGLRAGEPGTEIVVLTMEASPVFAKQALEAGAAGLVLKERADSDLPEAIRCAARGEEFVSPPVAARLAALREADGNDASSAGDDALSGREVQILRLIALGYTSREIADQLRLSRRTIESHRSRIHQKLGLATRADLVGYALGRRLLVP